MTTDLLIKQTHLVSKIKTACSTMQNPAALNDHLVGLIQEYTAQVAKASRRQWCDGVQDEFGACCDGPEIRDYIVYPSHDPDKQFPARWCMECATKYRYENVTDSVFMRLTLESQGLDG